VSNLVKRRPKGEYVEGDVFAVPLFVVDKAPQKRFYEKDFSATAGPYAFARIISNERGGGLIIEVFNKTGDLDNSLNDLGPAKRLFRPVAITSLPIDKGRWLLVREGEGYDKERDSQYSQIQLVVSPFDNPRLWNPRTGTRPIPLDEVQNYEAWEYWLPHHLEQRIIDALEALGKKELGG
jgi:Immunity protein 26